MRRAIALLAVLGGVLVGCGDDWSRTSSTRAPSSAPSDGGSDSDGTPEALQLTAPLVGGGMIDLTQYAGTTVALWFWAPT